MKKKATAGLAAFLALTTSCAFAADILPVEAPEAVDAGRPLWALQITPYMWAAGLKGDISPFRRAPTIPVEKSFGDIFDDLNFGGFVNLWARYDRFVFSGDAMYTSTTDAHSFGSIPQLPGWTGPYPSSADVDVDTRQFTSTLTGGYRVLDVSGTTLDLLGGLRIWHVSNRVKVGGLVNTTYVSASHKESFSWVDPVIGARLFHGLTDRLSFHLQADVGGFDVGSKITYQALATFNYILTDHLSTSVGYKVLGVDYRHDGHVFDTKLHGPVLGMTYRF